MPHDFTNIVQSNIPISTAAPTHYVSFPTHTYFLCFFQIFFQKFFWALFWGPRGSCPLFSNSPSPATYPHIFSDVSPLFSLPSSRDWDSWWLLNRLMKGVKVHVLLKLTLYYFRSIPAGIWTRLPRLQTLLHWRIEIGCFYEDTNVRIKLSVWHCDFSLRNIRFRLQRNPRWILEATGKNFSSILTFLVKHISTILRIGLQSAWNVWRYTPVCTVSLSRSLGGGFVLDMKITSHNVTFPCTAAPSFQSSLELSIRSDYENWGFREVTV